MMTCRMLVWAILAILAIWACLAAEAEAIEVDERLPPPSRPRPRPQGGFSSFLSGFLGSVTKTATVDNCPGKCIHAIASLICDQVLENVDCPTPNMRCCVEKGGGGVLGMPPLPKDGMPPLPKEKEDKVSQTTTTPKTTTTEATTTTKKKRRRKKKTTTTTTTTTTSTTTKTTTTRLTTTTAHTTTTDSSDDYYEYTSPANTSDSSRLTQSIATISLVTIFLAFC